VSTEPTGEPDAIVVRPQRWLATRVGLLSLLGIVAAFLVLVGGWTYRTVEASLRELRSDSMQGLLDAQVNSLRVWVAEELADAERIARDPAVRRAVLALVERAEQPGADPAAICASPERERVNEVLRPLLADEGSAGHNVINAAGRLLSTRYPDYCGLQIHPQRFKPLVDQAFLGKSRFVRPVRDTDRVALTPSVRAGGPLAWMHTPIRDDAGGVRAVLGIAEPAEAGFSAILATTRPGRSGEVYAFDHEGFMLSESRFLADLQRMQVVPADGSALLNAQLRVPAAAVSEPKLTRLAQAALDARTRPDPAGQRGVLLEPYRSYHGTQVVGAWRWLPDFGVAVAFEIDAEEAYAPLGFLKVAFAAVLTALVVAVIAALGVGLLAAEFKRRFRGANRAGEYVIEREIGSGGMANVYLAQHALLKRPTAIKILKGFRATDEMVARFRREAQLASLLSHPNTVEIFDYGRTRDGQLYYAMEYLDGITLAQMVEKRGPVPAARVIHLLRQVCAGLAEAHARGLVHRDIKPENIMACRRGIDLDVVKILDFGLVKNIADPHSRDLTSGLRILGTPLYMAPERIRSPSDVDARADLYSVGAVAFFLLTGTRLFKSEDDLELSQRVLNDLPPRPSSLVGDVPESLDDLVMACLEKRREDRPQSAAGLVALLDALALTHPWTQTEAAQAWSQA
jgi:tRNA A-37 threonylcarbamoyl transferase component Bud32